MTFSPGSRAVSDLGRDDLILPFCGRAARRARPRDASRAIARPHSRASTTYPEPVSRLVGEAVALCALLGSSLKIEGRFQLQTRTDGAVDMLVVDFDAPGSVAGFCALRRRAARRGSPAFFGRAARQGPSRPDDRPGPGHLALSGRRSARRAGARGGGRPVLPAVRADPDAGAPRGRAKRDRRRPANGVRADCCVQFLPQSEERRRQADLHPGDCRPGVEPPADRRGRSLVRSQGARRDGRGSRTRRSDAVERAAALSAFPRARRQRVRAAAAARRMPLLARTDREACCAASRPPNGTT